MDASSQTDHPVAIEPAQEQRPPMAPELAGPDLSAIACTCAIARACGLCPANGGVLPEPPIVISAEQSRKWKVTPPAPAKKRGARRRYELADDLTLAEQWNRAKSCGVTKKEFAQQLGRRSTEIDKALNRLRARGKAKTPPKVASE
jgi:hypothetical protein